MRSVRTLCRPLALPGCTIYLLRMSVQVHTLCLCKTLPWFHFPSRFLFLFHFCDSTSWEWPQLTSELNGSRGFLDLAYIYIFCSSFEITLLDVATQCPWIYLLGYTYPSMFLKLGRIRVTRVCRVSLSFGRTSFLFCADCLPRQPRIRISLFLPRYVFFSISFVHRSRAHHVNATLR